MQIQVNKNLDEYRDDFYKGLTLKQTVLSVLTVVVGTGVFLVFHKVCGIGQTTALYLSFPVALPVAVSGFLKIHGMTFSEYLKKKRSVTQQVFYPFVPQTLQEWDKLEASENRKKQELIRKPILETQEEMTMRIQKYHEETDAGV